MAILTAKQHAIGLYLEAIRDGNPEEALAAHTGNVYVQHSTGVKDGQAGFLEFFHDFLSAHPDRDIQVLRALQDGTKVFLHVYQSLDGGAAQWVTADFFDTDTDGRMIEHWDVIQGFANKNPSGRTMIDGPRDIADLDKTAANKAHVAAFIQACLIDGEADRLPEFINKDTYLQHNAEVGDGLEHFQMLLANPKRDLTYQENFLLVGEGNFVATLNKARWDTQDLCQCDLFRLEDGLIVEHWDVSEPVPPKDTWVNSGKF